MLGPNEWKKRIVERFIERSSKGNYMSNENTQTLMESFGFSVDSNFFKAWDYLLKSEIIIKHGDNEMYFLNTWKKPTEIREIFQEEPLSERSESMRPERKYFENLVEQFTITTEQAWPNQGTYYFCTDEDDPSTWNVIIRSKPNKPPIVYRLGSIKDKNSRLSKMWIVILSVWIDGNKKPIYKKLAEDKDQKTFGNNRQPATAGFTIFNKFGWLEETSRRGKQIFYKISDEKSHEDIINGKTPICPRCGRPSPNRFCNYCNAPI